MEYNRRQFISFMGKAGLGAVIAPQFLLSCGNTSTPTKGFDLTSKERLQTLKNLVLEGLVASDKDDLLLANGLNYHTIIKWNDKDLKIKWGIKKPILSERDKNAKSFADFFKD